MTSENPETGDATPSAAQTRKPRPFVDLIVSIIIPSFILLRFSGDDRLGPTWALIVALAFPIGYGLYDLLSSGKRNFWALFGIISVLATGSIGLFKIDSQWLAVKEAAVPLCFGIGVIVASKMGYPPIKKLLFNPTVMNVDRINEVLEQNHTRAEFDGRLNRANYFLAGTFLFSAIMNYILAKTIVTSASGTADFNKEVGELGLWSYPIIAGPSFLMVLAIFWFLWRTLNRLTGLSLEEIMVTPDNQKSDEA